MTSKGKDVLDRTAELALHASLTGLWRVGGAVFKVQVVPWIGLIQGQRVLNFPPSSGSLSPNIGIQSLPVGPWSFR